MVQCELGCCVALKVQSDASPAEWFRVVQKVALRGSESLGSSPPRSDSMWFSMLRESEDPSNCGSSNGGTLAPIASSIYDI